MFVGLSPLVMEGVADERERIRVQARTPDEHVTPGYGVKGDILIIENGEMPLP